MYCVELVFFSRRYIFARIYTFKTYPLCSSAGCTFLLGLTIDTIHNRQALGAHTSVVLVLYYSSAVLVGPADSRKNAQYDSQPENARANKETTDALLYSTTKIIPSLCLATDTPQCYNRDQGAGFRSTDKNKHTKSRVCDNKEHLRTTTDTRGRNKNRYLV